MKLSIRKEPANLGFYCVWLIIEYTRINTSYVLWFYTYLQISLPLAMDSVLLIS